jgi:hypothetical protein
VGPFRQVGPGDEGQAHSWGAVPIQGGLTPVESAHLIALHYPHDENTLESARLLLVVNEAGSKRLLRVTSGVECHDFKMDTGDNSCGYPLK